jgi:hypothetical protein
MTFDDGHDNGDGQNNRVPPRLYFDGRAGEDLINRLFADDIMVSSPCMIRCWSTVDIELDQAFANKMRFLADGINLCHRVISQIYIHDHSTFTQEMLNNRVTLMILTDLLFRWNQVSPIVFQPLWWRVITNGMTPPTVLEIQEKFLREYPMMHYLLRLLNQKLMHELRIRHLMA